MVHFISTGLNKRGEHWSWLRTIKVSVMTGILALCLVVLLVVPDATSQNSLVTVAAGGRSRRITLDDAIDEVSSTPEVLSVTLRGSLVPPDVTRFSLFSLWVDVSTSSGHSGNVTTNT